MIKLYLDAGTTAAQERELADSFANTPPADEEEMAVYQMIQAIQPVRIQELPDAVLVI